MEDAHGLDVLERLRLASGATTDNDLAQKLGLSRQSIAKVRATKSVPSSWIPKAATAFGVSTDWLFFGRNLAQAAPQPAPAPPVAAPETPRAAQETACTVCAEWKRELETERRERRELTAAVRLMAAENRELTSQNHELTAENRHLWKENSELREKCARLEERQYQRSVEHGDDEAVGSA